MAKKKTAKTTVNARSRLGARAVQVDGHDGSSVAIIDSLRVLITKDDGVWLAEGVDVDYAIDGDSLPDVKKRFEQGLAMTIASNLRVHGTITPLLRPAPQDVIDRWYDARNMLRRFQHTTIVVTPQRQSELPFDQIVYLDASKTQVA